MVDDASRRSASAAGLPATVAGDPATDATVLAGREIDDKAAPARTVQRLGRYRLVERLGIGGMAEVYLAEQAGVAGFQKKVVVKRILPHLAANRQFVEMFAREARVAARVSHPHVVQIFELGEDNGEFFIAMEHIDGLTLHRVAVASWEQQRGLPIDVVVRTLADAALGLHAAHTLVDDAGRPLNLVHRDVSPDNLMLSKDGVTKVLDFGIAKGDLGGPQTKTGNLRGKIPFMPPEQILGEILDGRADLYAIGVSAYWMLTGQRPFDRQSDWHTMQAIMTETPPPPSASNPGVPAELDALVLRLLQKDRTLRPENGRVLADALEALASPSSIGGKKTTEAWIAGLLPTTAQRASPVSEARDASPRSSLAAAPSPAPAPAPAPISALHAIVQPSALVSSPTVPSRQSPGLTASPPEAGTPAAPAPTGAAATTTIPPRPAAIAGDAAPVGDALDGPPVVRPVTTPSTRNAFANLLLPAAPAGPSLLVRAAAVVVAAVIVVGGAALIWLVVGPAAGPRPAGAGPMVDAGPVDGPRDAGVIDSAPPPPPPPPAPAAGTQVTARRAPVRILWQVGDTTIGLGEGTFTVPAGTRVLRARDPRRGFAVDVPVVEGVVDYEPVLSATVMLVRTDGARVTLGNDDVTRARRIPVPPGRHVFRVERGGRSRDIPIEVGPRGSATVDAR